MFVVRHSFSPGILTRSHRRRARWRRRPSQRAALYLLIQRVSAAQARIIPSANIYSSSLLRRLHFRRCFHRSFSFFLVTLTIQIHSNFPAFFPKSTRCICAQTPSLPFSSCLHLQAHFFPPLFKLTTGRFLAFSPSFLLAPSNPFLARPFARHTTIITVHARPSNLELIIHGNWFPSSFNNQNKTNKCYEKKPAHAKKCNMYTNWIQICLSRTTINQHGAMPTFFPANATGNHEPCWHRLLAKNKKTSRHSRTSCSHFKPMKFLLPPKPPWSWHFYSVSGLCGGMLLIDIGVLSKTVLCVFNSITVLLTYLAVYVLYK